MSVTAFNRMRREQEQKKQAEVEVKEEVKKNTKK